MDSTNRSSYDEVLYHSWPFPQSHPDRLATMATLFGMDPPPVISEKFRMLELGCACGDNLIPLAMQHPQATFLGIDSSLRQVEMAHQAASRLGVDNVGFQALDILEFPDDGVQFDYIVAHGVYSWVPSAVRDKLLAICNRHLHPSGIAYVSYNVYPGSQLTTIVRDVLMYHTRNLTDAEERIQRALAFLRFMANDVPHDNPAYAALYEGTFKAMQDDWSGRTSLYHDLLEPNNEPVYFHEFIDHAARHDLQFLGEADFDEMQSLKFPLQVSSMLETLGDDIIQREQYLDIFKHRRFRQTLLCHREVSLHRQPRPGQIERLLMAAEIRCDRPDGNLNSSELFCFTGNHGVEARIDHPLAKAALLELAASWPHSLAFTELEVAARRRLGSATRFVETAADQVQGRRELSEHLLQLYAAGLIEAHLHQPRFTTQISERPVASSWARLQAERGNKVTNLRHAGVQLSEVNRQMILLLDGSRDRSQLLEDLTRQVGMLGSVVTHDGKPLQGTEDLRNVLNQMLDDALHSAGTLALLVA